MAVGLRSGVVDGHRRVHVAPHDRAPQHSAATAARKILYAEFLSGPSSLYVYIYICTSVSLFEKSVTRSRAKIITRSNVT